MERSTTKGRRRADSVADSPVATATRRGQDAAGGSWGRRKKMEEEEEDGEGRSMHLLADGEGFLSFKKEALKVGMRNVE